MPEHATPISGFASGKLDALLEVIGAVGSKVIFSLTTTERAVRFVSGAQYA